MPRTPEKIRKDIGTVDTTLKKLFVRRRELLYELIVATAGAYLAWIDAAGRQKILAVSAELPVALNDDWEAILQDGRVLVTESVFDGNGTAPTPVEHAHLRPGEEWVSEPQLTHDAYAFYACGSEAEARAWLSSSFPRVLPELERKRASSMPRSVPQLAV